MLSHRSLWAKANFRGDPEAPCIWVNLSAITKFTKFIQKYQKMINVPVRAVSRDALRMPVVLCPCFLGWWERNAYADPRSLPVTTIPATYVLTSACLNIQQFKDAKIKTLEDLVDQLVLADGSEVMDVVTQYMEVSKL